MGLLIGYFIFVSLMAMKIYGAFIAFQKSFILGLFVLLIPFSAEILAISKLVFKVDLIEKFNK